MSSAPIQPNALNLMFAPSLPTVEHFVGVLDLGPGRHVVAVLTVPEHMEVTASSES